MIPETINTDVLQLITTQQAWHYMVLPTSKEGSTLNLCIAHDRLESSTSEELGSFVGL